MPRRRSLAWIQRQILRSLRVGRPDVLSSKFYLSGSFVLRSQFSRDRWRWFGDSDDQRSDSNGSGRNSFDVGTTDHLHRTRHFIRYSPFSLCVDWNGRMIFRVYLFLSASSELVRGATSSTMEEIVSTRRNDQHHLPFNLWYHGSGHIDSSSVMQWETSSGSTGFVWSRTNALVSDKQMKIDMSAVFDADDHFLTANFGAAAGYAANALKYFSRYSAENWRKTVQKILLSCCSQ